jgi:acyl dehydratase
MIEIERPFELEQLVGQELGVSEWLSVTEANILAFAGVTRDRHWVHTNPDRARKETSFGGVLAHGFLTLSLATNMLNECLLIGTADRWVNYGIDRLRFLNPVVPGNRLRLRANLGAYAAVKNGARLSLACTMEIEAVAKPAFTADWTVLVFESAK